jgi:hypothetical protein
MRAGGPLAVAQLANVEVRQPGRGNGRRRHNSCTECRGAAAPPLPRGERQVRRWAAGSQALR